MRKNSVTLIVETVNEHFLPFVRRPSRYIGGEINQVNKKPADCEITVALCFPDIYEVGMSHTGFAIIYEVLNKLDWVAAERVFTPWLDAEQVLRQKNIPLFSLESKAALGSFDIIGFSLTTELCYTNVLNMLDLAGVPLRAAQRSEKWPIIIGGGGMTNCCEPIAEFFDMFILGEGEEAVVELVELIREQKKTGASKSQILLKAAKKFRWAYVPSLYKFEYRDDKIKSFQPTDSALPNRFENAVVNDLDGSVVPSRPIVPFAEAVHERVSVEIMRGCPGRCRFCQASFCRRPIRYRSADRIVEIAKQAYHATGFDTVSLLSLSTADYPGLEQLITMLDNYFRDRHVGISVPSLRVDQQLKLLPQLLTSVRKSGLTVAIEAATERLRRIINKPITDEDIFAGIEAAYRAGWQKVKLYFMVGLPGETEDDIRKIVELSYRLAVLRRKIAGKTAQINAAISWMVPKPHTPFGWLGQKPKAYFENAKKIILDQKRNMRAKFINFKFHDIDRSILEAVISRADRRFGDIIETAWQNGARFDLWNECFDYEIWKDAFAKFGADPQAIAAQSFAADDIVPWQHLGGPEKAYLLTHLNNAVKNVTGL